MVSNFKTSSLDLLEAFFIFATVLETLRKPYPCNKEIFDNLVISLLSGSFIFFFLLLFEPFDSLINYSGYTPLGYGLITFAVSFFIAAILPQFFSNYFSDVNWTVLKEIGHLSFIVFMIGVVNFFYAASNEISLEKSEVYTFNNFILSIIITFVIGAIPIIIVVLYNQTRLLKKYKAESEKINKVQQSKSFLAQEITLKGEGKNEELKFTNHAILFIKSESNYCEIHVNEDNYYRKELLRGSLSSIEDSLKELSFFVRVHRSYIVNFNKIDKVSGTAQGYKIHFKNVEHSIPVSRKQSAHFKSLISLLS